METTPTKHRATVGMLLGVPFSLFTIALGGLSYYIRHWRSFFACAASPHLLTFPILWQVYVLFK